MTDLSTNFFLCSHYRNNSIDFVDNMFIQTKNTIQTIGSDEHTLLQDNLQKQLENSLTQFSDYTYHIVSCPEFRTSVTPEIKTKVFSNLLFILRFVLKNGLLTEIQLSMPAPSLYSSILLLLARLLEHQPNSTFLYDYFDFATSLRSNHSSRFISIEYPNVFVSVSLNSDNQNFTMQLYSVFLRAFDDVEKQGRGASPFPSLSSSRLRLLREGCEESDIPEHLLGVIRNKHLDTPRKGRQLLNRHFACNISEWGH
ncbi:hypothetical protein BLNAU_3770 [Blattamonas nauphoetae]|uniref:Uncharacterized protein n=1 Tax=Blattamonas nauphoetae TaxID=2049346 RepID=A0ABQ9YCJ2_9EUKA|nr:hypothetical protein BLNAU_3770 [Blattamonas nauphoetae]